MTPAQEAKIIALCERIGMPWERAPRRDDMDHPWYGHALNLRHLSPNGTSDLIHDVAHWLVAAPDRRCTPSFGLDTWAAFEELADENAPEDVDSVEEEKAASLLGILIERAMHFDWRYTWGFHCWDLYGWDGLRPAIRALRQRGLLHGLTPTCLLNSAPRRATPSESS